MNRRQTSRTLATILLGILFAWFIHRDEMKWNRLGREAFLADQSRSFDRANAQPPPFEVMGLVGVLFAAIVFGGYELLAMGIRATLKPFFVEEKSDHATSIPFT